MPRTEKLLSTGQVAHVFSVTPDTILKWVKSGRLPATRTAGGHYRIRQQDLKLVRGLARDQGGPAAAGDAPGRSFLYCWEFNSKGSSLPADCLECPVFRTRAYRCYEVVKLQMDQGYNRLYCQKSCEECDYFNRVHREETNVLVVTDNQVMAASLKKASEGTALHLAFSSCEYTCSAMVDRFHPDYAVIDCALGRERSRDFARNLLEDPRIPYIRVILAMKPEEEPGDCNREIFARIHTPFEIQELNACIDGVRTRVEPALDRRARDR